MKNYFLHYAKLLLIYTFILSFTGCSIDEDIDNTKQYQSNSNTIQKIGFEEFKKDVKAYEKFQEALNEKTLGDQMRYVYNVYGNFIVDTESLTVAEFGDLKSYNFSIYTGTETERIENLVVYKLPTGEYTYTIAKYNLTEGDKALIEDKQIIDLSQKSEFVTFANLIVVGGSCYEITKQHIINGVQVVTQMISVPCPDDGSGSGSGTGFPSGGSQNGDVFIFAGTDGTSGTTVVYPDLPVFDNPDYIRMTRLFNFRQRVNANQLGVWADANVTDYNIVADFVAETGTTERTNIGLEIIYTANQNPNPDFTSDDFPGVNEGLAYNWWRDEDFIKEFFRFPLETNPIAEGPEPNAQEILLFTLFPAQALMHRTNSLNALDKTMDLVNSNLLTGIHNGKADSFRHAYWNAMDTAEFGAYITKLFTTAHEWNSGNHPLETQMDLFNNEQGRNLGTQFNFYTPDSQISTTIVTALLNGYLLYLTPLDQTDNIISTTQLSPTNQ